MISIVQKVKWKLRIEVNLPKVPLPQDSGLGTVGYFWGVTGSVEPVWVIPFLQAGLGRGKRGSFARETSEGHLSLSCTLDLQRVLGTAVASGLFLGKVSHMTPVGLKGARVCVVLRDW